MIKISKSLGVVSASAILVFGAASVAFAQSSATPASPAAAGTTLEVHISNEGTALVRGAKVTSVGSSTINATQTWGSYSQSWVVKVGPGTEFTRRYGGASSLGEITVGDYVSFSGPLDSTQSVGMVNAKVVKDFSIQKVNTSFSGTVASVNASSTTFVLTTKERGNIVVQVSNTTTIKKGSFNASFSDITVGQKISKTYGVWDTIAGTLAANEVHLYVNEHLLQKRTFEGKLSSVAGSTTPTTFTYTVGSTMYTVNLAANTTLLSRGWNPITVGQLHSGDTIRIYGAVQAADMSKLDAYVVRDTSIN